MKKDTFFVTTPIYYTNDIPHIGHAYSSIIADSIARFNKISDKKTKFSTWVDENSQKVLLKAEEQWMEIEEYLDIMATKHKQVWDWLDINYTDFVRTTDKLHHKLVREVLQKSFDNGDIYEWEYEGMYCVWCESFKKDDDLVYLNKTTSETFPISDKVKPSDNIIKICPDHLKTPDKIKEKNYFFKLSKYQDFLEEFYEQNPDFVMPSDRFNEVKAFVKRWLDDFSISRETNKFGVKLPFDESQVTYVWFDALFNYVTVTTKGWEEKKCSKCPKWYDFWPADLHVVGKDIIRFHAIYWPAMLKSAWYEMPKNILTTGFLMVDWQKMSKSLGNVIDPFKYCEEHSKDLMTLYLLSAFNIGQDWDYDQKQAILIYNAKLANNLWNLVNRVVVLSLKLQKESGKLEDLVKQEIKMEIESYNKNFLDYISNYNLKKSLDLSFSFLDILNKYADDTRPWNLVKEDEDKAREVLYTLAEWLRQGGLNLYSFFPDKMWEMFEKFGLENYYSELEDGKLEEMRNKKELIVI